MDSPAWMFTKALSHRQKVLRLFKAAMRQADAWHAPDMLDVRFHRVLIRQRFDAHATDADPVAAKRLLVQGCEELWRKRNPVPHKWTYSPDDGLAYQRQALPNDSEADAAPWVEREAYPWFYNRRNYRKKELLSHWAQVEAAWDAELAAIQRKPPPDTLPAPASH